MSTILKSLSAARNQWIHPQWITAMTSKSMTQHIQAICQTNMQTSTAHLQSLKLESAAKECTQHLALCKAQHGEIPLTLCLRNKKHRNARAWLKKSNSSGVKSELSMPKCQILRAHLELRDHQSASCSKLQTSRLRKLASMIRRMLSWIYYES